MPDNDDEHSVKEEIVELEVVSSSEKQESRQPKDISGIHLESEGQPKDISGIHLESDGQPKDISGIHLESDGQPKDISGIHLESDGKPKEISGIHLESDGKPKEISGIHLESDGKPKDISGIHLESDGKPKEISGIHLESDTPMIMESELIYTVEDVPPWHTCILLGFQHYLTMASASLAIPVLLSSLMCIKSGDPARGAIISTNFFLSGIITLLQTTLGVRLPIVQSGSAAYIAPAVTILSSYFEPCSNFQETNMTDTDYEESWKARMSSLSGNIAVASLLQVILGWTGIIGFMLRWITPLTIAPTIALIGFSLIEFAGDMASQNWPISLTTMMLTLVFSQYLENVTLPIPRWKQPPSRVYIFKFFPVLLTVLTSWLFCYILTISDLLAADNKARTDLNLQILNDAPWFYVPYPGQFGPPTVSLAGVIGMLAAVIASVLESIGDYYACAEMAGAPPPPAHAINRGIFIEGFGGILTSLFGTANGTTSLSQNIGAIAITKVGSRRVVQYSAIFMILLGVLGKIGALFVIIPEPIVGGLLCVMFAIIAGVGFASLQHVKMNSSRNIFILGSSLFIGLMVPQRLNVNKMAIQTGSVLVDQTLGILLKTPMFVGGAIGFILDNTIPGTPKDRGLLSWGCLRKNPTNDSQGEMEELGHIYNVPFGMEFIRRHKWLRYLPVSPTFSGIKNRK